MYVCNEEYYKNLEAFLEVSESILSTLEEDDEVRAAKLLLTRLQQMPTFDSIRSVAYANKYAQIPDLIKEVQVYLDTLPPLTPRYESARQKLIERLKRI